MVQWFSLLYQKLNIRGQWFEPFVLCFLFFIFQCYFSFLFYFIYLQLLQLFVFLLAFLWFPLFLLVVSGDGYLSVPGRPIDLDDGRARAYCACSRCWCGLFGYFLLAPTISLSSSYSLGWMDGWRDFTSFSIEFQLYQDDGWVMDGCVQWESHLQSKHPASSVLESGTTRSAGQHLHHRATGFLSLWDGSIWAEILSGRAVKPQNYLPSKCSNAH